MSERERERERERPGTSPTPKALNTKGMSPDPRQRLITALTNWPWADCPQTLSIVNA